MVTLSLNISYLSSECYKVKIIQNSDVKQVWDYPIHTDLDQGKIMKQESNLGFKTAYPIPAFKH